MRGINNNRFKGAVLLEALFMLGILILAMPFIMNEKFKFQDENKLSTVAHKMKILSLAVSNYVSGNPEELKDGINIIQGDEIKEKLSNYGLPSNFKDLDVYNQRYEVLIDKEIIKKTETVSSLSYNAVIVIYPGSKEMSVLNKKKLITYLGVLGGVVNDSGMVETPQGSWDNEVFAWPAKLPVGAIVIRVRLLNFFNNYITRIKTNSMLSSNIMLADLYMNYNSIKNINSLYADEVYAENILKARRLEVQNTFGKNGESPLKNALFETVSVFPFASYTTSQDNGKSLKITNSLNIRDTFKFNQNKNSSGFGRINLIEVDNLSFNFINGIKELQFGNENASYNSADSVFINKTYLLSSNDSNSVVIEYQDAYEKSEDGTPLFNVVGVSNYKISSDISVLDTTSANQDLIGLFIDEISTEYINFGDRSDKIMELFRIDLFGSTTRIWDVDISGKFLSENILEVSDKLFNDMIVLQKEIEQAESIK